MKEHMDKLIKDGCKLMEFKRDTDLITNEQVGVLELKNTNGYNEIISVDDNAIDDIEKIIFKYLVSNENKIY